MNSHGRKGLLEDVKDSKKVGYQAVSMSYPTLSENQLQSVEEEVYWTQGSVLLAKRFSFQFSMLPILPAA
jgi:hypothetical protein